MDRLTIVERRKDDRRITPGAAERRGEYWLRIGEYDERSGLDRRSSIDINSETPKEPIWRS